MINSLQVFLKDKFTVNTNEIDQVIDTLAKVDYARDGSTDAFWLKDGLVFAHTEQEYDEGLNPLTLQWKDKMTTMYPYEKSHDGYVGVVLHVNEEQEFTCQED